MLPPDVPVGHRVPPSNCPFSLPLLPWRPGFGDPGGESGVLSLSLGRPSPALPGVLITAEPTGYSRKYVSATSRQCWASGEGESHYCYTATVGLESSSHLWCQGKWLGLANWAALPDDRAVKARPGSAKVPVGALPPASGQRSQQAHVESVVLGPSWPPPPRLCARSPWPWGGGQQEAGGTAGVRWPEKPGMSVLPDITVKPDGCLLGRVWAGD